MPGGASGIVTGWILAVGLAAALLATIGAGVVRRYALRSQLLALPGARSSHALPTPTGGGAGLVCALLLLTWAPGLPAPLPVWWVVVAAPGVAVLAVVGWVDDRRNTPWRIRLAVQFLVSLALISWWCLQKPGWEVWAGWPARGVDALALGGMVWIMNAWNFMDGSDGMAGSQGLFSALALAWLFAVAGDTAGTALAVVLAGACAGFLVWNLPTAKLFLGDTGSVPLGFAVAALLGSGLISGAVPLAAAPLVMAPFMIDAGMTLLTRVMRGERWYTAHRQHLYQRLIAHGWPHGRVLLLYQGVNVLIMAPAIVITTNNPNWAWPLAGMGIALLTVAWCAAVGWLRSERA